MSASQVGEAFFIHLLSMTRTVHRHEMMLPPRTETDHTAVRVPDEENNPVIGAFLEKTTMRR
jgi:hypothetical protein